MSMKPAAMQAETSLIRQIVMEPVRKTRRVGGSVGADCGGGICVGGGRWEIGAMKLRTSGSKGKGSSEGMGRGGDVLSSGPPLRLKTMRARNQCKGEKQEVRAEATPLYGLREKTSQRNQSGLGSVQNRWGRLVRETDSCSGETGNR